MVNDHKAKKTGRNGRFADLAILGETVFHVADVANIWGINNKNTLRKTLSRYVLSGLLFRLQKGLYSVKPLKELDPRLVGIKALHSPAYVSCESVLSDNGIINQLSREITLVSNISKRFVVGDFRYRSRKMADRYLHNGVGIETVDGIRIATIERAVSDVLYFNPLSYMDAQTSEIIDWKAVETVSKKIGYSIKLPKMS